MVCCNLLFTTGYLKPGLLRDFSFSLLGYVRKRLLTCNGLTMKSYQFSFIGIRKISVFPKMVKGKTYYSIGKCFFMTFLKVTLNLLSSVFYAKVECKL